MKFLRDRIFNKAVFTPVSVNLITAIILFAITVSFKGTIYSLLSTGFEYPIYVVAEPYIENENGNLFADLFVINTTEEKLTESELEDIIKTRKNPDQGIDKSDVLLIWRDTRGKIVNIVDDDKEFNRGKYKFDIYSIDKDEKKWIIKIKNINGYAIVKLKIITDYKRRGPISRNSQGLLPFVIEYPGN